jgi:hypothetical protein
MKTWTTTIRGSIQIGNKTLHLFRLYKNQFGYIIPIEYVVWASPPAKPNTYSITCISDHQGYIAISDIKDIKEAKKFLPREKRYTIIRDIFEDDIGEYGK